MSFAVGSESSENLTDSEDASDGRLRLQYRAASPAALALLNGVAHEVHVVVPPIKAVVDPLPALLLADVVRTALARKPILPDTEQDDVLGVAQGQLLMLSAQVGGAMSAAARCGLGSHVSAQPCR